MHYLIVAVRMKLDAYNSLYVEEHFRWREPQVSVLRLRITATISSFLTPLLIFLSLIFHSLLDNCQSAVLKFKIFAFIFNNLVCSVCVCVATSFCSSVKAVRRSNAHVRCSSPN